MCLINRGWSFKSGRHYGESYLRVPNRVPIVVLIVKVLGSFNVASSWFMIVFWCNNRLSIGQFARTIVASTWSGIWHRQICNTMLSLLCTNWIWDVSFPFLPGSCLGYECNVIITFTTHLFTYSNCFKWSFLHYFLFAPYYQLFLRFSSNFTSGFTDVNCCYAIIYTVL